MSKWIQKEVDKQLEKIEDNKEENHKKIVEKYFESPTQNKTIKMWKIWVPATASFLIMILSVSVILNNTKKSPVEYFVDNEVVVDSTIDELQSYATSFELAFEKVTVNNNKRVYDSVTQDTLRFSLNLSKGSASIDMLYITNERYEYESNNNLLDRKKVYQGIEISYLYIYSSYRLSVNAYLENDGQKIIIEYQQRSMEDSEEPFWTFMNEFITVK